MPPSPTHPALASLLAEADTYAAAGQRSAAEATYRRAAALYPEEFAPYLGLARLFLDWNWPDKGLEAVMAAEDRGAPIATVEALRAGLYGMLQDWSAALRHAARAVSLDPTDLESRRWLAKGFLAQGRITSARRACEALEERVPTDPFANECLGVLSADSKPAVSLAHLERAGTRVGEALRVAVEDTLEAEPAFRMARLGQVALSYGRADLATAALQMAVTLNPGYAEAHALLGQAMDQVGRAHDAQQELQRAVALAPDSVLARSLLGAYLLRHGSAVEARPHLEAAYDLDPSSPVLALYLAWLYAELGAYDATDAWLKEAIRLAADSPSAMESIARFCVERGLVRRGLEAARALVEMEPDSATGLDLLGWAFFLYGDLEAAQEHIGRAVQVAPEWAWGYYHLSKVYIALGRPEEARSARQKALDLCTDPGLRDQILESGDSPRR